MRGWLVLLVAGLPVAAQADGLVFSPRATEACLASTTYEDEYRFCVGRAANACMDDTPGGGSTVGMGGCLNREYQYWDARLNAAYQVMLASAKRSDEALKDLDVAGPTSQAEALRDMQRAWIGFRDAACGYELSLWGGGTGGGPALSGCLMLETGWQALRLEARAADFKKDG